jgi:glycosyltransferase involved in cell wall biosynthesis
LELRSGENITIVPEDDPKALANSILRLIDDHVLARTVGAGQREFIVDHFSMEAVARDYIALYKRVLTEAERRCRRR